jgi:hypothetical protein
VRELLEDADGELVARMLDATGRARPMKIERIRIQAFGRLRDFDSGPDPLGDLVVVLGPNEGGKTTLFQFLATALTASPPPCGSRTRMRPGPARTRPGSPICGCAIGSALEVHRQAARDAGGDARARGPRRGDPQQAGPRGRARAAARLPAGLRDHAARAGGSRGESWERIQDRLIAGLGAADLRPARLVADELEEEAGQLWRPNRAASRGSASCASGCAIWTPGAATSWTQTACCATRSASWSARAGKLDRARADREAVEVYIERFNALRPCARRCCACARSSRRRGAPRTWRGCRTIRRASRVARGARGPEQTTRLAALVRDMEAPRRRSEALRPAELKLIERRL